MLRLRLAKIAAFIAGRCGRRSESSLWLYVDGQLDAAQRADIESHLASCAECRAECENLQFSAQQVTRLQLPETAPRPIWQLPQKQEASARRALWPRWVIATAALLFLGVTSVWYLRQQPVDSWAVARLAGAPKVGGASLVDTGRIRVGDWVETDETSRARIQVGAIGYVEVDPGARLQLLTARANEHRFSLTRGKMHASILAPPRLFFIETPAATAIDYGCAYTLEVDESGASLLQVTAGWVSLQAKGREVLAPAGTLCRARPQQGPGTPYFEDASERFQQALEQLDFADGGATALSIVLSEARPRDSLSLFHLWQNVAANEQARVYDRLVAFVPLPNGLTQNDVLQRTDKLAAWREKIDYVSLGIDPARVPTETGTLRPTGTMNEARYAHTATRLSDGRVLIAGGLEEKYGPLESTEIYDPATGKFLLTGRLTTKRVGHTATLLNDGRVLLAGGSDATFFSGALASAEVFDPRTNSFRAVGKMSTARLAHRATLLPNGKVLITGGQDERENKLASAELYDPTTETFHTLRAMNTKRADHTATLLKNGLVLLVGGSTRTRPDEGPQASAELFDPVQRSFLLTGAMSIPRYKHSAAMLPDGRVLILGGSNAQMSAGRYASTEIYDPTTGKFTASTNLNTARYKIRDAVVTLPSGKILVAGGGARPEVFDPATSIFAPVAGSLGVTRYYATATLLENGEVLILGGYLSGSRFGMAADLSAWLYKP